MFGQYLCINNKTNSVTYLNSLFRATPIINLHFHIVGVALDQIMFL